MLKKKITLLAVLLAILLPKVALADGDVIINNSQQSIIKSPSNISDNDVMNDDDDAQDEVKAGNVRVTTEKNGSVNIRTPNTNIKTEPRTSSTRVNRRDRQTQPSEAYNTKPDAKIINKATTTIIKNNGKGVTSINKATTIIKNNSKDGKNTVVNSQKITCNNGKTKSVQVTKIKGSGKKVTQNSSSLFKCP